MHEVPPFTLEVRCDGFWRCPICGSKHLTWEGLRDCEASHAGRPEEDTVEPEMTEVPAAPDLLAKAAQHMLDRAATYDSPEGERSMGQTVQAFYAITGHRLTEAEGWLFMQVLKDVRLFTRGAYHADSAEDCIAYAALKAEAKAQGV